MIDNDSLNISDEMVAAYIDGNCNRLEEMVITASISDESVAEVLELSDDCKGLEYMNDFDPLDISGLVDDFTRPLREYNELKNNIDSPDDYPIM